MSTGFIPTKKSYYAEERKEGVEFRREMIIFYCLMINDY